MELLADEREGASFDFSAADRKYIRPSCEGKGNQGKGVCSVRVRTQVNSAWNTRSVPKLPDGQHV